MSWLDQPGEYTASRGVECYHPLFLSLDQETMEELHGRGIRVNTWTVNDIESIRQMAELGVDAVISNFPDRVAEILSAR